MNKTITLFIILIFLLVSTFMLSSQEIEYRKYVLDTVKIIENGIDIGTLGYNEARGPGSPAGILTFNFDEEGNIYFADPRNKKILILGKDFKYKNEIKTSESLALNNIYIDKQKEIILFGNAYGGLKVIKLDKNGKLMFMVNTYKDPLLKKEKIRGDATVFVSDSIIIQLQDGSFYLLENPSGNYIENYNKAITSKDKIKERLKKKGINFDESNNRMTKDGKIVSKYFKTYYKYLKDNATSVEKDIKIKGLDLLNIDLSYVGEDKYGNTYWHDVTKMYVLNNNGTLVDAFYLEEPGEFTADSPAVDPEGNVYILKCDKYNHFLYKYRRTPHKSGN